MQGIGFIIAGLSPWLSGLLRSLSGNYTLDWSWHAILRPATHGADACALSRHTTRPSGDSAPLTSIKSAAARSRKKLRAPSLAVLHLPIAKIRFNSVAGVKFITG